MDVGTYRINVVFLFQSDEKNYSFEDTIKYKIIYFFEANKIVNNLINSLREKR